MDGYNLPGRIGESAGNRKKRRAIELPRNKRQLAERWVGGTSNPLAFSLDGYIVYEEEYVMEGTIYLKSLYILL